METRMKQKKLKRKKKTTAASAVTGRRRTPAATGPTDKQIDSSYMGLNRQIAEYLSLPALSPT